MIVEEKKNRSHLTKNTNNNININNISNNSINKNKLSKEINCINDNINISDKENCI
jgi:hypothetical protein